MGDLGELGTPHEAYEDSFGYFGARIRLNPDLTDLTLIKVMRARRDINEDSTGADALDATEGLLAAMLHSEDVAPFWDLVESNRQDTDDLGDLVEKLVTVVSGRPTKRPSSSSTGRASTGERSGAGSSSPGERLEAQGRPDLALIVALAEESRASA